MKFLPFLAAALLLAACTQQPAAAPLITPVSKLPTVSVRGISGSGAIAWYRLLYEARMKRIADLAAYADAGQFPMNDGRFSDMTPVFVDAHNVPCAVAHLMREAGASELVEEVRKKNNLVRLWVLKEGPVLDWILLSGLTREECALIQPSYDHKGYPGGPREPDYGDDSWRDVAALHIQDHLRSTAKKLRADTVPSLLVALQRLKEGGKLAGDYCVAAARSAVLACPGEEAMVCWELLLNAEGATVWADNMGRELAPGVVARVEWRQGAACSIVEMFASPTLERGSPLE